MSDSNQIKTQMNLLNQVALAVARAMDYLNQVRCFYDFFNPPIPISPEIRQIIVDTYKAMTVIVKDKADALP